VKKRKAPCIKKLSAQMPEASLSHARKSLDALKQLTSESVAIADGMHQIIQKLMSPWQEQNIFLAIDENFRLLTDIIGDDIGLIKGKHAILGGKVQAGVVYIESITDEELVSSQVIEPLLLGKVDLNTRQEAVLELIQSKFIYVPNTKNSSRMGEIVESLLSGDTVLFINGLNTALIIGSGKIVKRSIEKPENEGTVLASLESFIEDLDANCSMVIKRLPTSALRFETFTKGVLSRTKIKLLWIDGSSNAKIVEEARSRITQINIDNIDGIGVLAELIEDNPWSIFPQYRQTQRPDVVAKALADGHFAVLCSNSPFAFFAPTSLWDNFKTMDDYAERSSSASYLRIARYMAFLMSILLSPLYLSFVTFNQIIVPPSLAANIATGREGVPFPSGVELLLLTFGITVIREGALRITGSVGYFIGTLAAVVIGQATVAAGYVSASIIIVVAVAEISAFAIATTTLVYTSRLINYFFVILSSVFGIFGLINGIAIIFWHLASLESFGVPYLYPVIPFDLAAMKDTFLRIGVLKKRLRILAPGNRTRTDK